MTSGPGKAMIRDVIASTAGDGALAPCSSYTREQIQMMLDRAARRGEPAPDSDTIMDLFVAPIMYRILFQSEPMTMEHARELIQSCLDTVRRSEEHTSELQSLMRISYAVFCLKKKKKNIKQQILYIANEI